MTEEEHEHVNENKDGCVELQHPSPQIIAAKVYLPSEAKANSFSGSLFSQKKKI